MLVLDANALKRFVKAILPMTNEARVVCDGGVKVVANDPGNVAMVIATISKDAFEKFEDFEPFGLDVNRLNDVVSKMKGQVQLDVGQTELTIRSGNLTYRMGLIDPSAVRKPPKVPELKFASSAVVDGKELSRFLKLKVGEYVTFYSNEEGLFAEMKGDVDKAVLTISRESYKEAKSTVNRELFEEMVKNAGSFFTLSIGNDIPVKVEGDEDGVNVTYLLAPVIQE